MPRTRTFDSSQLSTFDVFPENSPDSSRKSPVRIRKDKVPSPEPVPYGARFRKCPPDSTQAPTRRICTRNPTKSSNLLQVPVCVSERVIPQSCLTAGKLFATSFGAVQHRERGPPNPGTITSEQKQSNRIFTNNSDTSSLSCQQSETPSKKKSKKGPVYGFFKL